MQTNAPPTRVSMEDRVLMVSTATSVHVHQGILELIVKKVSIRQIISIF